MAERLTPGAETPIALSAHAHDRIAERRTDETWLREVWADAQGRLLRVRLPGMNVEATRDEPPPETPPPTGAYEGTDPLPNRNRY